MDAATTPASTGAPAAAGAHARGDVLLAIADGIAEKQPDDATLAHVFSCEQCSGNLRELRRGLQGLAAGPGMSATAELGDLGEPDDPAELAAAVADRHDDPSDRSRNLIWKVALMGAVLAGALFYMRSLASSFR